MILQNVEPIQISEINKNRFNIYMLFTRHPNISFIAKELRYFSNDDNFLLGLILLDYEDQDYSYVICARDENRQFRAFEIKTDFRTEISAITALKNSMIWHTAQDLKLVEQGYPKNGLELFKEVVKEENLHPCFINLKNGDGASASKKAIIEVANHLNDIDGNFVEQFQSKNGFDARIWELYLFATLIEMKFEILREFDRPDFVVKKDNTEIAIEAVIVGRKTNEPVRMVKLESPKINEEKIKEKLANETPLKFGSSLYSKLKKEYWKLDHIKNKPLVFAIADFHSDQSMIWSFSALVEYLYGSKQVENIDENGNKTITIEPIKFYTKETGEKIPSGFFEQPNSEFVSGILFSATGTLAKFSRMGIQAGFGNNIVHLQRVGIKVNHSQNATEPDSFSYKVDENGKEEWREGLNLFHNPKALNPIDVELFEGIGHHKIIEGKLMSFTPDFHPYASMNYKTIIK